MMWRNITKIFDRRHMANHKNTKCKDPYDADEALPPGFNTMVTAQTLSCCSRFKKIVNFMSQRHHLFFIQRNRETLNGETHTPQSAERKARNLSSKFGRNFPRMWSQGYKCVNALYPSVQHCDLTVDPILDCYIRRGNWLLQMYIYILICVKTSDLLKKTLIC